MQTPIHVLIFFRVVGEKNVEGQSSKMGKTGVYNHTYLDVRKPKFSFEDIAGYGAVKEKFNDMVVLPLKKQGALKKAGIEPPTGVIVWGPLGTGKGHMIEASAEEAGVNYIIIRGRECTDHPDVIEDGFKFALENRPCVIHLMDIDWLAPRKDADYSWGDGLTEGKPDKFGSDAVHLKVHEEVAKVAPIRDVVVLASCYRIDVLDQAFTRTSMLGRKIYVPRPNFDDRSAILKHYLKGLKGLGGKDIERLAEATDYHVGWDIEALCRKAKLAAVKRNSRTPPEISIKDFESALKTVGPWLSPQME
jgi:transitional endoplasmic reticulum ATPase